MEKKSILVLFCEGKHDSAFLSIVLKSMGYENYREPIATLPIALQYISEKFKTLDTQVLTMGQVADDRFINPFPWIFQNERTIIALYRLDGIDNIINVHTKYSYNTANSQSEESTIEYETIEELIQILLEKNIPFDESQIRTRTNSHKIKDVIQNFLDAEKYPKSKKLSYNTPIHFSFFLDADSEGITNREIQIKDSFRSFFSEIENLFCYNPLKLTDNRNIGLFVFTSDETTGTGDLEDVTLSIVNSSSYKNLLEKSEKFIVDNENFSKRNTTQKEIEGKFYTKKSRLGIAGQMRISGADLETIIIRSNFFQFNHNSFKNNWMVNKIKKFLNEMFH